MTHQRAIEAGARADAEFDGRTWLAMPKHERERYLARSQNHHARLAAEGLVVVPATLSDAEVNRALGRTDDAMVTPMQSMFRDFYNNVVQAAAQQEQNAAPPLAGGE